MSHPIGSCLYTVKSQHGKGETGLGERVGGAGQGEGVRGRPGRGSGRAGWGEGVGGGQRGDG